MADAPAQSTPPGFSESLQACLREDAIVRADAAQLRAKLEEARAAAGRAREGTALPGRLLAALGRRKDGPSTPEEAAEIFARENVLRRQGEESGRVLQHYTRELDTHLADWLRAAVPVYQAQTTARVRLAGYGDRWELRQGNFAGQRFLVQTLGIALDQHVHGALHEHFNEIGEAGKM